MIRPGRGRVFKRLDTIFFIANIIIISMEDHHIHGNFSFVSSKALI
jgi:hypothetical protein